MKNSKEFLQNCKDYLEGRPYASAVLPKNLALDWLCRMLEENPRRYCPHGHLWTEANTRVRVRYRGKVKGLSIERDCKTCKRTIHTR